MIGAHANGYELDFGKLGVIVCLLVCVTLLAAIGTITGEAANYVFAATAGYVFGNGRLAMKHRTQQGLIQPVEPESER